MVEAKSIVDLFIESIVSALKSGDTFDIKNFGVFEVKVRKAKKARNVVENKSMIIPERKVMTFRFSKTFVNKTALNNDKD